MEDDTVGLLQTPLKDLKKYTSSSMRVLLQVMQANNINGVKI
jgi:hypothetical protein